MRRLLFVSPHFPPDSTAATHRARLLAPRLPEHGWEPTVLTIDPSGYEGALDPMLAASVPAALRVVRAPAWPASITRRVGLGDLGLRAFTALGRHARRLLSSERFDAVFITTYPIYPALLGPRLKRRFGVPFVLDLQDPWVGEWGDTVGAGIGGSADLKSRGSRAIASWIEPAVLRAADGVTAVSAATYEQAFARARVGVPLAAAELPIGWDERDREFLHGNRRRCRYVPTGDGFVHLVYVGTLLPTGFDTLRAVFAAWASWRMRDARSANRLRLHFIGTSNQRSGGAPRALAVARDHGLGDLVTEHPDRVDYFDALQALDDADGVLLIGSRERHYTASKIYPAMVSRRPLVAVFHAASTATALLRRFGRPPSVRIVAFDDERPAQSRVDEIAAALCGFVRQPAFDGNSADARVLDEVSAGALAGQLAVVLERVV